MAFQPITTLNVSYCRGNTSMPMGRLAYKDRKIFFEYTSDFLASGFELSPFKLPLKPGISVCEDRVFDGLFGIFNDSLPDGWGRLLLDRKLLSLGVNPGTLTPLDRLAYVGSKGMGALLYEPEIDTNLPIKSLPDLDVIANECLIVQENDTSQFVDDLLLMNGSSAGARPKILVSFIQNKNMPQLTQNNFLANHNDWIIKFRSSLDPKDIGPIEYAYHLMAIEAELDVPEARLFPSKTGAGYFGVKRFDRQGAAFLHAHTVSGLLHADYRIPSLDYETLLKATLWLTKNVHACEKQFRHAVFNVLAHNRDDHAKNFSFLLDENALWHISPAYDLTYCAGLAGEHCTLVMGEGKNPGLSHLLQLGKVVSIERHKALSIIEQTKAAVSRWNHFASMADVGDKSRKRIQTAIQSSLKNLK